MKKLNKNFRGKLTQAGSLMIEAMAMLALISLVTPTLYKKSAERTTELQDINTATHLRTMIKAVDNYVAANYNELLKDIGNGGYKQVNVDDLQDYLPYGYAMDDTLKNFNAPKISLRRQSNSITSYVELPPKLDVGAMRAARIASMVGSNGGYINKDNNAEGVGGIWGLTKDELGSLHFATTPHSIVAASSEAITSASSSALENEKYLQRTKVESEDQKWRNTMATDLYMGGVNNNGIGDTNTMHSIYGVNQLIIGAANNTTSADADLILTDDSEYGGSAFLQGDFSALDGYFTLMKDDTTPFMALRDNGYNDILTAEADRVQFYPRGDGTTALLIDEMNNTIVTNSDMIATEDVYLATANNDELASPVFNAGPNGTYINANRDEISLRDGQIILNGPTMSGSGNAVTTINGGHVKITTEDVMISQNDTYTEPKYHAGFKPKLYVDGNTHVNGILYTKELEAEKFDTLELHAGGTNFTEDKLTDRRLHATADRVWVTDPSQNTRLNISDAETLITGPDSDADLLYGSHIQMHGTDMEIYNQDQIKIDTNGGGVQIQNNLLNAYDYSRSVTIGEGAEDGSTLFTADVANREVELDTGTFRVKQNSIGDLFTVEPSTSSNTSSTRIQAKAYQTIVKPGYDDSDRQLVNSSFEIRDKTDKKIVDVRPNATENNYGLSSTVYISPHVFGINDGTSGTRILEVETDRSARNAGRYKETKGSVYIRHGAVEIQKIDDMDIIAPGKNENYGSEYGYMDADRFITTRTPTYADEYRSPKDGDKYDSSSCSQAFWRSGGIC